MTATYEIARYFPKEALEAAANREYYTLHRSLADDTAPRTKVPQEWLPSDTDNECCPLGVACLLLLGDKLSELLVWLDETEQHLDGTITIPEAIDVPVVFKFLYKDTKDADYYSDLLEAAETFMADFDGWLIQPGEELRKALGVSE